MGATAHLAAEGIRVATRIRVGQAHVDDADRLAVLVAEEGKVSGLQRLRVRQLVSDGSGITAHLVVHQPLHLADLIRGHGLHVGEVKAQAVGRDKRTGLPNVAAQHAPQCLVQEVRGRVVPRDIHPALAVNARLHLVAGRDGAAADAAPVDDEPIHRRLRVRHVDVPAQRKDGTRIADLTAALGVERRLSQHHLDVLPGLGAAEGVAVRCEKRQDFGLRREPIIPNERDAAHAEVAILEYLRLAATAKAGFGGRTAAFTLGGHETIKLVHVDRETLFAGDLLSLFDRKPIGVIENESQKADCRLGIIHT